MSITKARVTTKGGGVNSDAYVAGLLNRIELLKAERADALSQLRAQTAAGEAVRAAFGIDGAPITLSEQEQRVIAMRRRFVTYWRARDDAYWFQRLAEEFGELGASLAGDHKDPPEVELRQIAAICINWLEMLAAQPAPTTALTRAAQGETAGQETRNV